MSVRRRWLWGLGLIGVTIVTIVALVAVTAYALLSQEDGQPAAQVARPTETATPVVTRTPLATPAVTLLLSTPTTTPEPVVEEQPPPVEQQQPPATRPVTGTQLQPPFGDDTAESVKVAREDLAHRLGVSVESVVVAAVIDQEFSTDAFYCRTTRDRIAKEDSPAVMTGFVILLNVSGRRYEYHASGSTVIFCRPLP